VPSDHSESDATPKRSFYLGSSALEEVECSRPLPHWTEEIETGRCRHANWQPLRTCQQLYIARRSATRCAADGSPVSHWALPCIAAPSTREGSHGTKSTDVASSPFSSDTVV